MIEDENITDNQSDKNKSDEEYKGDQANGNLGDPSSKRNIGLYGATQRGNQKDELKNLHIGGSEATGYGNNIDDAGESASGPGFEAEGSEYANDNTVKDE